MLIPAIDLMEGKIVQLVQGERKALEFDDFAPWIDRFRKFPLVQVIDLDAAMDKGSNRDIVQRLCRELPCQVGGGVRTVERARELIDWGAKKAIVGSSLFSPEGVDLDFAQQVANTVGSESLVFSVDSRNGYVAVKGWKESTRLRPADAMRQLEPFCSGFLYTHIDTEGLMQGFPFEVLGELCRATTKTLIVAGGITSADEVKKLESLGVDCVVGMAIYTGALQV
jgi:phosphoribosylformimino-5-aminoimidazole carboxamide ribotide isomerase